MMSKANPSVQNDSLPAKPSRKVAFTLRVKKAVRSLTSAISRHINVAQSPRRQGDCLLEVGRKVGSNRGLAPSG